MSDQNDPALRSWLASVEKMIEAEAERPPESHLDFVCRLTDDQLSLYNRCADAVRKALDEILMPLSDDQLVWDCFPAFLSLVGEIEDVVEGSVMNAAVPLGDALGYLKSARFVVNTVLDDLERRLKSR